jgi:hypothetical protein
MNQVIQTRQLRCGRRPVQVWCSLRGLTRWISDAGQSCPCRAKGSVS